MSQNMNSANVDRYPFSAKGTSGGELKFRHTAGGQLHINIQIDNTSESTTGNDITASIYQGASATNHAIISGSSKTIKPGGFQTWAGFVDEYFDVVASGNEPGVIQIKHESGVDIIKI